MLVAIKPVNVALGRGNFGATVEGRDLLVPCELATVLRAHGVRTPAEAISYVYAFPSVMAKDLHWEVSEVLGGLDKLKGQLHGLVDPEVLNPPERSFQPKFGAFNPDKRW